ncbi:hypothetical protein COJ48_06290 [Bacillus cereus]|nr:hypothetical protein COJ48_06290 [Bacillus cereus]PGP76734.1 hypothetical protein CN997_24030 [Bacillus cereus]
MQFNQEPTNQIISPQITKNSSSNLRAYKTYHWDWMDLSVGTKEVVNIHDIYVTITPHDVNSIISPRFVDGRWRYPNLLIFFKNKDGGTLQVHYQQIPFNCGQHETNIFSDNLLFPPIFDDVAGIGMDWDLSDLGSNYNWC